jgi:(1->4)-alpha-D-glucan 1-alpha-D-glucosylmutase
MYRIPVATYRIQFSLNFRFSDARELVSYLSELGVTDLYASPRFKARKGSSHGYDVADPQRVNSELGTEREFNELAEKLKRYSMGLLLDIVPNHMVASHENPWWMDVLENGPISQYARYFDIDWHPPTVKSAALQESRVLLPVLGDLYGDALRNGELILKLDEAGFFIKYFDHRFPLALKSYGPLIEQILRGVPASARAHRRTLSEVLQEIHQLPCDPNPSPADQQRRISGTRKIKERLWKLYHSVPAVRKVADEVIRTVNGPPETPARRDQLDQILSAQAYRLAHWKIGLEEINYRRFFDINELVGLRMEDPIVFAVRHRLIIQLTREGTVTGLRVDHVDGLYDPLVYLQRLQACVAPEEEEARSSAQRAIYVVVEKVLGERERLAENWPVAGTTGYDFLNAVNEIFIDPKGLASLERAYKRALGSEVSFADVSYAGNKLVMEMLFAGEVQSLSHQLGKIAAQHRHARDLPMSELTHLLKQVTACLPVYRTYIDENGVSPRDREFLERALSLAHKRDSDRRISEAAFSFLRSILFLEPPEYAPGLRDDYMKFVMCWQQFTGPVMAKGLEDTGFYIHNSLISLNDVGGDPLREFLPLSTAAFHEFNQDRQLHWPHSLNATSTHDTKRGEDVRARINVLSELPREWEEAFHRWHRWNAPHRKLVDGYWAPTPNEEELLYQTVLGAWPHRAEEVDDFRDRLKGFMVKAAREAKLYTDWINPNSEHESSLEAFVHGILARDSKNQFFKDFPSLQKKLSFYGFLNSLSQVLLKIGSPGVPDLYQGEELWDYNLVDPDNRRPVDFQLRARLLDEMKNLEHKDRRALQKNLLKHWQDGRIKLYLTWKALNFRRSHRELFEDGEYLPSEPAGKFKQHLCAFTRRHEGQWVLVAVPRFLSQVVTVGQLPLGKRVWGACSVQLPKSAPVHWRDVITGQSIRTVTTSRRMSLRVADLFQDFPVAMCSSVPS